MRTLLAAATLASLALRAPPARAWRLNVVAATELRVDPAVRPGGAGVVDIALHLRDDRGVPLRGREVTLRSERLPDAGALTVRTDERGEGVAAIDPGRARRVRVTATYAGDSTSASAQASVVVDLDAPFVTPELLLPGDGVTLGEGALEAVVTVRVGQVQTLSPSRLAVELSQSLDGSGRRRALAAGETDGGGRASLIVPSSRFDAPGVVRVTPRVDLGEGRVVEGAGRELLVRGRTLVSLLREDAGDDGDGASLHGAVVLTTGGAVPLAAVRVVRGERTLAAARADERGHFRLRLGPEALLDPGTSVRAVFEPTEPWYIGAESLSLELTPPRPPPIHWSWGAAPLGLASVAAMLILLRRKEHPRAPVAPPSAPEDHVAHVAGVGASGGASLRVVVLDRSTGREVTRCRVRVDDGPWCELGSAPLALAPGVARCELAVESEGFAPRTMRVELPRAGEYRVQVALRTWREALFAVVRPRLQRARRAEALPTPRELARGGGERVEALVRLVEEGCYGRVPPGPEALRAAEQAAAEAGPRGG